jgi:hypothetical protein
MQESIKDYQHNINLAGDRIKQAERMINVYSFLRLAAIVLGFVSIYQSLKFELIWVTELVFFAVVIFFGWLVSRQSGFEKTKLYEQNLRRVNENEIGSISGSTNIYPDGSAWQSDQHVYTSDLDIFGPGSLFKLINRCSTVPGNAKLADWLLHPAESPAIRHRQEAVQELAGRSGWKLEFQAKLLFPNKPGEDPIARLFQYLTLENEGVSNVLKLYVQVIGWFFIPLLILSVFYPVLWIGVIVLAIINLFIIQLKEPLTERTEVLISKTGATLAGFSDSFQHIEKESWNSFLCKQYAARLSAEKDGLSGQIKRLSVLTNRMNLGSAPVIGFILKVSMLWNLRQLFAIEDWKKTNKHVIVAGFEVISDFEALCSFAGLKINYSEYHFPEIADDAHYTFTATSIGHPLISVSKRVLNDFHLDNELKIDIITGSNMAGKSTFLRTLGINTVLALSGAPVCARAMRVTPMTVFSYMRIRDSLNENTSTFKAELDRLQLLLQVLKKEEKVFFLIDEMLRGTNSVDKYRGSKAVIEKLIVEKAVGIVATHDLQIAQLEKQYPDYVRNFYFDIRVEGQEMQFDYKLKAGECKTFNAALLLKGLGIEVES